MSDKNIKTLVYSALFTALVTVATAYLKIPTAIGYLNLGDGFIFAAGVVLGPIAAVVGGIGSMIADLMAGYMIYAPITLLIKGCMGLMIGLAARSYSFSSVWKNALMFLAAEAVMVCGYFLFEAVVYGAGRRGRLRRAQSDPGGLRYRHRPHHSPRAAPLLLPSEGA